MSISLWQYVLAVLVVAVGAMIQGSLGFGLGLVSAPALALIDATFIPGPLLLVGVAVTLTVFLRERGAVDWKGMKWAIFGRVIGTIAGGWAVVAFSKDAVIVLVAVLVLAGVLMTSIGWKIKTNRITLSTAGLVSGVMGTLTSVGGPPMALVYQRETAQKLRATLAGFFLVGATFSLLTLAVSGGMSQHDFALGALMLPGYVIGMIANRWASRFLDKGYSRVAVLTFSALSSIVLLLEVYF
ncbi:MAG: TSUP family transporter [Actinobacteria bacterium]|nr:TSUP family transporter [Actinomycetota bacterium]